MTRNLIPLLLILAVTAAVPARPQARAVTVELAYTHLFLALADNGREQPGALHQRRAAFVRHMGLTPQQGDILLATVQEFQKQEAGRTAKAAAVVQAGGAGAEARSDVAAQLTLVQQERDRAILDLAYRLLLEIGPEGATQLTAYVNGTVKPNIRFGKKSQ